MASPSRSSSVARYRSLASLSSALELADLGGLAGRNDVDGVEILVDVDAQVGPVFAFEFLGDLLGPLGQVAHVADAGLDRIIAAQKLADRPGLGRRLDDHKRLAVASGGFLGHAAPCGRLEVPGRNYHHGKSAVYGVVPESCLVSRRIRSIRCDRASSGRRPTGVRPAAAGSNSLWDRVTACLAARLARPPGTPREPDKRLTAWQPFAGRPPAAQVPDSFWDCIYVAWR